MTIVCGDSHTATHGAFGAIAFGIGTTQIRDVLATQTLLQKPAKNMRITIDGDMSTNDTVLIMANGSGPWSLDNRHKTVAPR